MQRDALPSFQTIPLKTSFDNLIISLFPQHILVLLSHWHLVLISKLTSTSKIFLFNVMFSFFQTCTLYLQNVKMFSSTSTNWPNYFTSRIFILPYSFSFPHFKTKIPHFSMSNFMQMFSVTIFTVSVGLPILLRSLPQNLDHP